MSSQRRAYIEASFSLGALIAENPVLLREVENLVGNGFRGLDLPRGVRVRARGLLARIRKGPEPVSKPFIHETSRQSTETMSFTVRVAEAADAASSTLGEVAGDGGSNPSANDSPEAA